MGVVVGVVGEGRGTGSCERVDSSPCSGEKGDSSPCSGEKGETSPCPDESAGSSPCPFVGAAVAALCCSLVVGKDT